MKEAKTYEQAYSRPSKTIWPGCGDGRCMPCGSVHDFCYSVYKGVVHRFRCSYNNRMGCPQPIPKQEHDWVNGRCSKCKRQAGWIGPDGVRYPRLWDAKRAGVQRKLLIREDQEELMEMLENDSFGG
jgi:hypothetical protein